MAFGDRLRKSKWGRAALGIATGGLSEAALGTASAIQGKKDPFGRAIAGVFTGGLSEGIGGIKNTVQKNKQKEADLLKAVQDQANKSPRLNIDENGPAAGMYRDAANVQYRGQAAPQYTSAQDASAWVRGMEDALGVQRPSDTRETVRKAVMGDINRGGNAAQLQTERNLASSGQDDSGMALLMKQNNAQNVGAQKAQANAQIEQDYLDRQAEYDRMLMGAAQQQAGSMSSYGMSSAGMNNQIAADNARMRQSGLLGAGQALSDDQLRRQSMLFQQNEQLPWETNMNVALGNWAAQRQRRGENMQLGGQIFDGLAQGARALIGAA